MHLDGFSILLVNKTAALDWTYVRDVGYDREWPLYFDGLPTKNITCGANAWQPNRNHTLTADVIAGSEVGMRTLIYPQQEVFNIVSIAFRPLLLLDIA